MIEDVIVINTTIPTEADWADYQTELDCQEAYDLYAGKDAESLKSVFVESIDRCVDGLHFMPPKVFHYYASVFADYVLQVERLPGLQPENRALAAAGLFTLLENKLHISPMDVKEIYPKLIEIAKYVAEHQSNYYADKEQYGDFSKQLVIFNALAKESHII